MARILTGVQSTGTPHLGNILGAVIPAIELSKSSKNESFFFIADMHSLTQIKNGEILRKNTINTAAVWLACGIDTNKSVFYKQSDIPEVTELAWYLNCYFPYQRLTLAHSFKDKSKNLKDINSGLFTYPLLMAADILLYDADIVPVGKDQLQHIEITRDLAIKFNKHNGETFVIPSSMTNNQTEYIPGTDGKKMSKSKNNTIDIFLDEKSLRKQIMKIKTDSVTVEEPKNHKTCTVFKLFSLISKSSEIEEMKKNYINGGLGYGDAKQLLFEKVLKFFKAHREKYNYLQNNPNLVISELKKGSIKAKETAKTTIKKVRNKIGF